MNYHKCDKGKLSTVTKIFGASRTPLFLKGRTVNYEQFALNCQTLEQLFIYLAASYCLGITYTKQCHIAQHVYMYDFIYYTVECMVRVVSHFNVILYTNDRTLTALHIKLYILQNVWEVQTVFFLGALFPEVTMFP